MKKPIPQLIRKISSPGYISTAFLACALFLSSCRTSVTLLKISRPPRPDTSVATPLTMSSTDSSGRPYALSVSPPTRWPPRPDTSMIELSRAQSLNRIEVVYYTSSPVGNNKYAYIFGPENEIIDSAKVITLKDQDSVEKMDFYQSKVVFKLNGVSESTVIKVLIPNDPWFPNGREEFYLRFD